MSIEPTRPQRESLLSHFAVMICALVVMCGVLAAIGWGISLAMTPAPVEAERTDQNETVARFREIGLEIGRNGEDQIQVVATRYPLLLTDQELAIVDGLPHLEVLDLRGAPITDQALVHTENLPNLRELYLGGSIITDVEQTLFRTTITDAAIPHITKLKTLRVLSLARTGITDAGIAPLSELPNLESLYLVDVQVTDDAIEDLAKLKSLKHLYLHETPITAEGVKRLQELLPGTDVQHTH
ncbi:hypothetical protein LOC68_14935 [Blastopirellula sp. JC732]|uniref:Leucine Rich repeats (2 copies) n=1 Tax=Blastopirellula sediminis TaxID=2894196 RepID=A0A9X1MNA0_9BACT|nr:hypothetical protein [Blastopirellula sediminis]MCC9607021.1 hypothetical protein [Blastopirellula sediminis]MCC9629686.1 hypothetical protein [Blastopirellula sediminis]